MPRAANGKQARRFQRTSSVSDRSSDATLLRDTASSIFGSLEDCHDGISLLSTKPLLDTFEGDGTSLDGRPCQRPDENERTTAATGLGDPTFVLDAETSGLTGVPAAAAAWLAVRLLSARG